MKKVLAMILCMVMVLSLAACGEKPKETAEPTLNVKAVERHGFQMEDYLLVELTGFDGYAYMQFHFDTERLIADFSQFLVEEVNDGALAYEYPGCTTPEEYLNEICYYSWEWVDTDYDWEYLNNGDVVHFYLSVPEFMDSLLTVDVNGGEMTYKVKDLEKFTGLDPFAHMALHHAELVEQDGEVGYILSSVAASEIVLPEGNKERIFLDVDVEEDQVFLFEDTVRVYVPEDVISEYEQLLGKGVFKKTETTVKLSDNMAYLPAGDKAQDAFTYIDETCEKNMDTAIRTVMNYATESETQVEMIGMMLYYDEEGKLNQDHDVKFYNQFVAVYKITNEAHPEGWYSYMAPNGYIMIGNRFNRETNAWEKDIGDLYGDHLESDLRYYHSEDARIWRNGVVPMSFEENGVQYPGHLKLEDMFAAMRANMPFLEQYDHLTVTESLENFVQVY